MKVSVMGAGNSGLAMAAHLTHNGHEVTLWNRSADTIRKILNTRAIHSRGMLNGSFRLHAVTTDMREGIDEADLILVTTPTTAHRDLAEGIARCIVRPTPIVLCPGRTFGAVEFRHVYEQWNDRTPLSVAETQTTIHTCRKTTDDTVHIIAFKDSVRLAALGEHSTNDMIDSLPACLQHFVSPAASMIETSIGNVGMILHCAPLLFNVGCTESKDHTFKHYYDGITPTIARFIERMDEERIRVSAILGHTVESTREWLLRTYHVSGDTLYDCIRKNAAYATIDAPESVSHRYITEDVPCGLVPLESIGRTAGLAMTCTTLIIDLASALLDIDFRATGRNLEQIDPACWQTCLREQIHG